MPSRTEEEAKLRELILYIATETDADPGATKLNKYLYFADFAAMRILGRPITGVEYQKLPWGPAPRRLLPVRDGLVASGAATVERRADPFGYVHDHLVALRAPDMDLFTAEERTIIDGVIEALRPLTAGQVSDLSHREAGWQLAPRTTRSPTNSLLSKPLPKWLSQPRSVVGVRNC